MLTYKRDRAPGTTLPAAPLVELVERRRLSPLRVFTENDRRNYYRGRARGWYLLNTADRLAVALGYHPAEIWGGL